MAINTALEQGQRGLPGGSSLHRLLQSQRKSFMKKKRGKTP